MGGQGRRSTDTELVPENEPAFTSVRPPLARPIEYLIVAVGLLICLLLFLLYGQVKDLTTGQEQVKQTQAEGKARTLLNRGIQCDLIKSIGATEPKECSSKELAPYRDPNIKAGSTASARKSAELARVLCFMINQDPKVIVSRELCPV